MGSVDGWRFQVAHRKAGVGPTGSRKFLSWSYVEGSVLQQLFRKGGVHSEGRRRVTCLEVCLVMSSVVMLDV